MYLKLTRILWSIFIIGVISAITLMVAVDKNYNNWFGELPDLKVLENPKTELASELYSADGELLGKYFRQNRSNVRYEDLSPNLINALIASEDIRFYDHSGIDLIGTMAIPYYLFLKGKKRGSSTITQQLAKNLFKTRGEAYQGTLSNSSIPFLSIIIIKLKEWILSTKIERSYTKKEIITMYLNTVDFGSNSFGIKVAAKTFFNTTPDQLNVQQSATLIGLLQSTTRYSPILNPDNSIIVRNTVIRQMGKYGFITNNETDSILKLPIVTDDYAVESHNTGSATYFRSEIRKELLKFCKANGFDLFADGLKIYTTIDSKMQKYAEEAVEEHIRNYQDIFYEHWKGRGKPWIDEEGKEMPNFLENAIKRTDHYKKLKKKYGDDKSSIWKELKKPRKMRVFTWKSPTLEKDTVLSPYDSLDYYKHFLHGGLISMKPQNGHIKAWVGGINYKYFKYDHVKQGFRQPGSTFKPILYTVALAEKYHPCFRVADVPITFKLFDGTTYTPKNSGSYSNEFYTLRQAMARSINTVAAYLIRDLTPEKVVEYAENRFGFSYLRNKYNIGLKLMPVPSLCLGTSDVSIFELAAAYGTFVNKGVWTEPVFITRIEDKNGNILKRFVPKTIEALDEELAYLMTYMLRGSNEEERGTSLGLHRYKFRENNEVAGKTGTTANFSDAWFVGATKDLVTGVWTGADDRSIHFRTIEHGQGARMAMPIFAIYMEKVFADDSLGYEKGPFPKPSRPLSIELDCSKYEGYVNPVDSLQVEDPLKILEDEIL